MRKIYFARKNEPGKKARTKLAKTFAKNLEADFRNLILQNKTQAMKNELCKMKTLACQNFDQNLEADFRDLSQFDAKLIEQKPQANLEANKNLENPTAKSA